MPTWPSTLPAPKAGSFRETPPRVMLRTEMDQGPAKVRRRFTNGVRPLSFQLLLTKAQVATLDTFFNTTVLGGSLEFDYTHPRTGLATTARFITEPTYSSIDPDNWDVSVELEILR